MMLIIARNSPHPRTRWNASRPELLVLAGGYDSGEHGTQSALTLLARHVALALRSLGDDAMPDIIFAGNPFAYREVAAILQSVRRCTISHVHNVLPAPLRSYVQSLSQTVDNLYWRKCQGVRDFAQLAEWTTDSAPIMTV